MNETRKIKNKKTKNAKKEKERNDLLIGFQSDWFAFPEALMEWIPSLLLLIFFSHTFWLSFHQSIRRFRQAAPMTATAILFWDGWRSNILFTPPIGFGFSSSTSWITYARGQHNKVICFFFLSHGFFTCSYYDRRATISATSGHLKGLTENLSHRMWQGVNDRRKKKSFGRNEKVARRRI